jgi:hypothetical protein
LKILQVTVIGFENFASHILLKIGQIIIIGKLWSTAVYVNHFRINGMEKYIGNAAFGEISLL